jgi:hypothetical protein
MRNRNEQGEEHTVKGKRILDNNPMEAHHLSSSTMIDQRHLFPTNVFSCGIDPRITVWSSPDVASSPVLPVHLSIDMCHETGG